jgi:hypothetical protein
MYESPYLEAYGTLRELTKIGKTGVMDPASIMNNDNTSNNDGCHTNSAPGSMSACPTSR